MEVKSKEPPEIPLNTAFSVVTVESDTVITPDVKDRVPSRPLISGRVSFLLRIPFPLARRVTFKNSADLDKFMYDNWRLIYDVINNPVDPVTGESTYAAKKLPEVLKAFNDDGKRIKTANLAKGGFPDLSGDGKVTQKDILMGKGVIKMKKGGIVKKKSSRTRIAKRGFGIAKRGY